MIYLMAMASSLKMIKSILLVIFKKENFQVVGDSIVLIIILKDNMRIIIEEKAC
jgi:hypothetical protein